ncbi:MAG: hypothetical protein Ct9H300mP1_11220 [Planctomycetaceae bacterium]|nr:MAG: hypothetical protein Ct9H300mP1_11220 [Planctomycetaceae bacterium]
MAAPQTGASATYRQSSLASPRGRLSIRTTVGCGGMNRRRLSIESWRDAMLTASGELDPALGGGAIPVDDPGAPTTYALLENRTP